MKFKLFLIAFFGFYFAKAQEKVQLKTYDHKELVGQTLKIFADNGSISLTAYQANIIKVTYSFNTKGLDVDVYPKEKLLSENVWVRVTQNLDDVFFVTDSVLIVVNKLDFSISFKKHNEFLFTQNLDAYGLENRMKILNFSLDSSEVITGFKYKEITLKKAIYQLGKQTISGNQKKNKTLSYPFYCSNKGYALYFEPQVNAYFNIGESQKQQVRFGSQADISSYYFIAGNKVELKNQTKKLMNSSNK